MLPWRVHFDPSAGIYRHATGRDFGYGLLAPLVCDVFETLGIAVTLWNGREWLPIHRQTRSI
ncbi:MAG TPA: hypothetical protein VGP93_03485, partial [Polyangiaceae bacterium]|nr:hypothetical protein [Polyangiaceae bacterium]